MLTGFLVWLGFIKSPSETFLRDDAESPPDNLFRQLERLEEMANALEYGEIEIPVERLAILDE